MANDEELRILIVDDHSVMRRIVKNLLKDIGQDNTDEADSGQDALEKLRHDHYDFVMSDLHMPGMDGFSLLEEIKGDDKLRHLPVMMVTADARRQDIVAAADAGADGFIVKPFTRATLEEKIGRVIKRFKGVGK